MPNTKMRILRLTVCGIALVAFGSAGAALAQPTTRVAPPDHKASPDVYKEIYPAFIAVFVIYIVLSFAFPADNKIPPTAGEGATYLIENFLLLPGLFPIVPFIGVAWSLSYEMVFYLAIPLVITLLRLRAWNGVTRSALFLVVATVTAVYCAINGGHIRLILFISGMAAILCRLCPRPSSISTLPTSPRWH